MKAREIKQSGWITGPVECHCTGCDWYANFIAVNSSIPVSITSAFEAHNCTDYAPPFHLVTNKSELRHDDRNQDQL